MNMLSSAGYCLDFTHSSSGTKFDSCDAKFGNSLHIQIYARFE